MTRRRKMLDQALGCTCVAAIAFGGTAAWGQAASSQPTSMTTRTAMTMAQTAMKQETMSRDLANRSPDIHWPEGFSPDQADLFSHNELRIEASCERVWKHIVEATKWPQWYPNSKDVQIMGGDDELNAGSVFRWTTFGLPLESRINEFTPHSRIGWYGYGPGEKPSFYHTWSHSGWRELPRRDRRSRHGVKRSPFAPIRREPHASRPRPLAGDAKMDGRREIASNGA
jgi:hypothetical protein